MKDWNKEFAFYAVALYKIGNYTDAALVGVIMFEKAIKKACAKEGLEYPESNSALSDAITNLGNCKPEIYIKGKLHNIRNKIRNKIIHEIDIYKINRDIIKDMILVTWEILDQQRYQKFKKLEKIDFLTADYHVIRIREIFNKQIFTEQSKQEIFIKFELADFQELYLMRNKMFSLASKIEKNILQTKYNSKIKIDLISRVDTTSAYVWIPMHIFSDQGEKLTSVSASILATPLDIRFYIDIGGGTHKERKDYYKYLLSESFKKMIEKNTINNLEYFDVDWYCFITESYFTSGYNEEIIKKKIEEANEKLEKYKNKIITWNKLLVGFCIDRNDAINFTFNDIKERLEFILDLYTDFKNFQNKIK